MTNILNSLFNSPSESIQDLSSGSPSSNLTASNRTKGGNANTDNSSDPSGSQNFASFLMANSPLNANAVNPAMAKVDSDTNTLSMDSLQQPEMGQPLDSQNPTAPPSSGQLSPGELAKLPDSEKIDLINSLQETPSPFFGKSIPSSSESSNEISKKLSPTDSILLVNNSEILSFISGNLHAVNPSNVVEIITDNEFIKESVASQGIPEFLNKPQSVEKMLNELDIDLSQISDEAVSKKLQSEVEKLGESASPARLLAAIGFDVNRVRHELELLKSKLEKGVGAEFYLSKTKIAHSHSMLSTQGTARQSSNMQSAAGVENRTLSDSQMGIEQLTAKNDKSFDLNATNAEALQAKGSVNTSAKLLQGASVESSLSQSGPSNFDTPTGVKSDTMMASDFPGNNVSTGQAYALSKIKIAGTNSQQAPDNGTALINSQLINAAMAKPNLAQTHYASKGSFKNANKQENEGDTIGAPYDGQTNISSFESANKLNPLGADLESKISDKRTKGFPSSGESIVFDDLENELTKSNLKVELPSTGKDEGIENLSNQQTDMHLGMTNGQQSNPNSEFGSKIRQVPSGELNAPTSESEFLANVEQKTQGLIDNNGGKAVIEMESPGGKLEINVEVNDQNEVKVSFSSTTDEIARKIRSDVSSIESKLVSQNLNVQEILVKTDSNLGSFNHNTQQNAFHWDQERGEYINYADARPEFAGLSSKTPKIAGMNMPKMISSLSNSQYSIRV